MHVGGSGGTHAVSIHYILNLITKKVIRKNTPYHKFLAKGTLLTRRDTDCSLQQPSQAAIKASYRVHQADNYYVGHVSNKHFETPVMRHKKLKQAVLNQFHVK